MNFSNRQSKLITQTTDELVGAWLTDLDDSERDMFAMINGKPYKEAYVARYPEGLKNEQGNYLPHALTETGLQVPVGSRGCVFISYGELEELAKSFKESEDALEYPVRESHEEDDCDLCRAVSHVLQFFEYKHLPEYLQAVSEPFSQLAHKVARGPQNAETTIALRKLLEAKDAAVRSVLCACESN